MVFGESPLKDAYRRALWGPWRHVAARLPAASEVAAHRALGRLAFVAARAKRGRVQDHLADALGPGRRVAARDAFEVHFANQYVGFSFEKIRLDTWSRYLSLTGVGNLDRALAAGHGVVLAHPHSGLPQLPLHVLGLLGYDALQVGGGRTAVALSSAGERAARVRASLEEHIAAELLDGNGYLRPVLRALRDGRVVFTAADGTGGGRELGRREPRRVLGRWFRVPVFPAWLAAHTGAALLPLHTWLERGADVPCAAEIGPPVRLGPDEVGRGVDVLAGWLETWLSQRPGDWHLWDSWTDSEGGLLVPQSEVPARAE